MIAAIYAVFAVVVCPKLDMPAARPTVLFFRACGVVIYTSGIVLWLYVAEHLLDLNIPVIDTRLAGVAIAIHAAGYFAGGVLAVLKTSIVGYDREQYEKLISRRIELLQQELAKSDSIRL